jgi:hypothetical protein
MCSCGPHLKDNGAKNIRICVIHFTDKETEVLKSDLEQVLVPQQAPN